MHHSEAQRGHGEAQSKAVEAHRYQKLAPRFSIASRHAFYSASCWWGSCCDGAAAFQHNARARAHMLLLFNTTRTASGRCCCCSTQRAQPPDPLKHGGRYRYVMVLLLFNTTRAHGLVMLRTPKPSIETSTYNEELRVFELTCALACRRPQV